MLDRIVFATHFLKGVIPVKAIYVFVDAASVITCVKSANPQVTEKRHLVEVALIREILERHKISLIHIAGSANPADLLTKFAPNETHISSVDFAETTVGTDSAYVSKKKNATTTKITSGKGNSG